MAIPTIETIELAGRMPWCSLCRRSPLVAVYLGPDAEITACMDCLKEAMDCLKEAVKLIEEHTREKEES